MDVRILPIAEEHIPDFHRVLDAVARERRYLAFLEAPPVEQTRAFVMNNMRTKNVQLVALAGDELAGWVDIVRKDRPIHAHVGSLGIGLLPQFRGRGLGASLIQAALQEAATRGFVRVELTVRADNARAISLYRKCGFTREGECRDAIFADGNYEALIMMANVDRSRAIRG